MNSSTAEKTISEATPPVGVHISVEDGVALVRLCNPKSGNALTREIYEQLAAAWDSVGSNPAVRAVVFYAYGDRFFCTGGDVSVLSTPGVLRRPGEMTGDGWRLTWRMAHLKKPVIVAVNGVAAGGGLGFVTDGDIVFASRNAKFVDPHVQNGQICGYGALRLVEVIGPSEAKRVALAGGVLTAERAYQLGMVNELFDTPAEALAAAKEAARKIVAGSPSAVRRTFELLQDLSQSFEERAVIPNADRAVFRQLEHPDTAEGALAWVERRKPNWAPFDE